MADSQMDVLRRHGIRPVKKRGQNFLLDTNLARAIADEVLGLGDEVLELGAGAGALTTHLLAGGAKVLALEVDRKLCGLLEQEHGDCEGFRLLEGDLAQLDWPATVSAAGERPVVAGNLPYVLTSSVLFAMAEVAADVAGGVFMVQREVAQRLTAAPGGRDYGVLATVLGSVFAIETVRRVPPAVFWPRPDVDSAVVRLRPAEPWPADELRAFTKTVKTIFGQRRKKVGTLLRSLLDLTPVDVEAATAAAGVDPDCRPEQLTPGQLRRLSVQLAERGLL